MIQRRELNLAAKSPGQKRCRVRSDVTGHLYLNIVLSGALTKYKCHIYIWGMA